MLCVYRSWLAFTDKKAKQSIILAVAAGLLFAVMVLNKGIMELVTLVFIILLLVSALATCNRKIIIRAFSYAAVFLAVFSALIIGYKSLNKHYNGCFTVTTRGAWAFYGNTVRRMEPLNRERLLSALAYVPGEGVCQSLFGQEKCSFWSFGKSEEFGSPKASLLQDAPFQVFQDTLILEAKQKILQNPAQYILLTAIEGLKMFFWESTQAGFVAYPAVLTRLFAWGPLKNGLRLGVSFLTLLAIIYSGVLLWRKRKIVLNTQNPLLFLYLCGLFIFSFVASYSIFCIIIRYLFPIVPLYLVIIAYVFQEIFFPAASGGGQSEI